MFKKINLKYIIYIIICYIYNYFITTAQPNLYILLASLLFTFMSVFFVSDLFSKLKIKNNKIYTYIYISTFIVYIFESMLNSSDFLNDNVINNEILMFIMFLIRINYIISTIIISFYTFDYNKKYLIITLFLIFTGICLYIEIISSFIPYIYIILIILFIIINFFDNNSIKNIDEGENK